MYLDRVSNWTYWRRLPRWRSSTWNCRHSSTSTTCAASQCGREIQSWEPLSSDFQPGCPRLAELGSNTVSSICDMLNNCVCAPSLQCTTCFYVRSPTMGVVYCQCSMTGTVANGSSWFIINEKYSLPHHDLCTQEYYTKYENTLSQKYLNNQRRQGISSPNLNAYHIREGLNWKKKFSFGHCLNDGGGESAHALFLEVHFWSMKRVYFFKNANVLNF